MPMLILLITPIIMIIVTALNIDKVKIIKKKD
jgi:hypothetical protein